MKLQAICIGPSQIQSIRGHDVTTAYVKKEVHGPVRVLENGLEGDDVAVHLDAIYAVSDATYDRWRSQLCGDDWPRGRFAENLIIEGLDEANLAVGDRIEIGDQVVLSVAGPRLPCFKLCWRLGQPDSFIGDFALSGQSGVYLNVENTGIIQAGDDIRYIPATGNRTLILDIARAIFAGGASVAELERIKSLPGLSQIAGFALDGLIDAARDADRVQKNRWKGFRDLRVDRIVDETPDTKSVYLVAPNGPPLPGYHAGQFLSVDLGETGRRVWSLSDFQENPTHYRLTIRKGDGPGTAFMHETLRQGDALAVSAPLGRFVLDRGGFKPVLMLAAGIGVTPLLSMLKAHIGRGDHMPPVYFVYCARNGQDQALRAEVDAFKGLENVEIRHVFSQPTEADIAQGSFDLSGRVTADYIVDLIEGSHIMDGDLRIDMPPYEMDHFICGPKAFLTDMRAALEGMEANSHQINTESYGTETGAPVEPVLQEAEVTFVPNYVTTTWDAGLNPTLLELAEAAGLSPENACRIGLCQTCRCRLTEGDVIYDTPPSSPPEEGEVLLCCARPASERLVLELPVVED
jgi:ferredoxin-NADP reductase/MOSC domain-containing protein YiiM